MEQYFGSTLERRRLTFFERKTQSRTLVNTLVKPGRLCAVIQGLHAPMQLTPTHNAVGLAF